MEASAVRVEIPSRRKSWQAAVLVLLMVAEAAGVVVAGATGVDVVFVISFSLGLLFAVLAAAQLVLGKEVITVSDRELVLETATWPWRYRRSFDRARIERLRSDPVGRHDDLELRAFSAGTIAFDFDGRVYRFGVKLAEDETRRLLELLGGRA
jgi:hypothetical protein